MEGGVRKEGMERESEGGRDQGGSEGGRKGGNRCDVSMQHRNFLYEKKKNIRSHFPRAVLHTKDTISELMMISSPVGLNTPLTRLFSLSNLWMTLRRRTSHSTPSLSTSSSVGLNVAAFFLYRLLVAWSLSVRSSVPVDVS